MMKQKLLHFLRSMMSSHFVTSSKYSMYAWATPQFGADLQKVSMPVPVITKPNQLLIKVKAASVNPIDAYMRNGYGDRLLSLYSQVKSCSLKPTSRLPLIAGRDCSGLVEQVGPDVRNFKRGDEVITVIDVANSGSHAEYVITEEWVCATKPSNVTYLEAAAFPFAACTAWSALVTTARINPSNAHEQRVLIHGGAGGVGTTAILLLKAWNVGKIVATCSLDSFDIIRRLGAKPVDYRDASAIETLINECPFDVILDCVGSELTQWSDKVMGMWRNCMHVSVVSPLLSDTDRYGVPFGLMSTAMQLFARGVLPAVTKGQWFMYAFFMPNKNCLQQVSEYLKCGKMKPIIDKVFQFDEVPAAYEKVSKKKGRGKTVIDFG